jgi:hypothetical protein
LGLVIGALERSCRRVGSSVTGCCPTSTLVTTLPDDRYGNYIFVVTVLQTPP